MHLIYLFIVAIVNLAHVVVTAFGVGKHSTAIICNTNTSHGQKHHDHPSTKLYFSGGFGGGASSSKTKKNGGKKGGSSQKATSSSNKKMNPRDAKRANQQLLERYGGDLGKGTATRIAASLDTLDPHLKQAAEIYKAIIQFDSLVAPMTPADRNRLIPAVQEQMVNDDRKKLQSLMAEHGISENDLHNIYQRVTWDASADAKATQADMVGNRMKPELQERITKACIVAVEATEVDGAIGKVLDVGCGHGAIVRSLNDAGLAEPDMYVGIDLSSEMVNNAIERYGSARTGRTGKGRTFIAEDFFTYDFGSTDDSDNGGVFDSVIFCSALHDLPDMMGAISKAASLLRTNGGKLIIIHAQGAQHVNMQHQSNPVMVKRGLPVADEWKEIIDEHSDWGLALEHEPADAMSDTEEKEGYLAILSKI